MSKTMIPQNYTPALNLYDTQRAIGTVKRLFADTLCATLNLYRVSAPLFLEASTGLNDDLNGVERKVTFDIRDSGIEAQVVQSLAKMGVILGTVLAGVLAYLVLQFALPKQPAQE